MTDALVWVSLRGGRSLRYHDRPDCVRRYKRMVTAIPTLRSYVEGLGFHRCHDCEHRDVVTARRAVIVALREQGLSFPEIARRIAARFDVGASLVHKEYWRAKRGA